MLLKNNILKLKSNHCFLYPCYDWHIGEKATDLNFIRRYIKKLEQTPNAYGILGGDLLDTTIYGSVGNVHDQEYWVNEQKKIVIDILKPVKHKIIGAVKGNHESRLDKAATYDVIMDLCRELDIEYWDEDKQFGIQLGKSSLIRVYVHHGVGAGTTDGGGVNAMVKLHWDAPLSDLIISGHIHKLMFFPKQLIYLNSNGLETYRNQWYVSCGTALGRAKYARAKAYPPAPIGHQILKIHKTAKVNIGYEITHELFM